jgi:hypothetical protein
MANDLGVNYLDSIAQRIKDRVPRCDLPEENTGNLFRIYAVLLLAKGALVDSEDVHNAWVAWMLGLNPAHESLVPFSKLNCETAEGDEPFVNAIRLVAAEGGFYNG